MTGSVGNGIYLGSEAGHGYSQQEILDCDGAAALDLYAAVHGNLDGGRAHSTPLLPSEGMLWRSLGRELNIHGEAIENIPMGCWRNSVELWTN